ncbi:MAG: nitroreductase [Isosphaera sp.]|nr:nitroreductase [Isosphaera sp.]
MGVGLVVLALSPWAARRLRRPTRSGVGLTRSPTAGSVAGGRAATVAADPRAVSETDYPGAGSASEKLGFLLNYAVLAPSSHNTQPWLFRPAGDWVEVLADRTRSLPIADPDGRALVISCGAALGNLRVALRRFGHCGEERDFPDDRQPDLLARVGLGDRHPTTAGDVALFDALPRRRTNRRAFDPRPVPDELLRALVAAAADDGVWVQVVSGEDRRAAVAELVAEGDVAQASDQSFRRELAAWMRPNWSRRRDGMPGYAHGLGAVSSLLGPVVIRTFDWGRGRAAADRRLSLGSPALAVLGTDGDGPEDWLAAGRALATVLLRARAGGVDASFLNQPIEVPGLRARLRALLGTPGHPQLLVRMGYGPAVRATPRRPVSEVTLPGGGRGAGRSG